MTEEEYRKFMHDKFSTSSILSYKEFGVLNPMWEIKNKKDVNKYSKRGQNFFLTHFCDSYDRYGGRIKFKYSSFSSKHFPDLVAAGYKLGIIIGSVEEYDAVMYISDCKF